MKYIQGLFRKVFKWRILFRFLRVVKYKILGISKLKYYKKRKNNIYLLYTMGKVASSALYETIKFNLPYNQVFHAHFLTEKNMAWRRKFKNNPAASVAEKIIKRKIDKQTDKRLKVITVVRDIAARDLSMIFQNLSSFKGDSNKFASSVEEVKQIQKSLSDELSLGWFDNEFREYLGVDIFDYEFDKVKGYLVISLENLDILIVKLEVLNKVYKNAFDDFDNLKVSRLVKVNETSSKSTAGFYDMVKKNIKIDEKVLDHYYNSRLMKHFYSKDEIESFRRKWSDKS